MFNAKDLVLADLRQVHRKAHGDMYAESFSMSFSIPGGLSNADILKKMQPLILRELGHTYEIEGELTVFDSKTGSERNLKFNWRPKNLKIEIPDAYKKANAPARTSGKQSAKKAFSKIGDWLDSIPDDVNEDIFSSSPKKKKKTFRTQNRKQ